MPSITYTYTKSLNGNGTFTLPISLFDSTMGNLDSVIVVESLTSSFVANPGTLTWTTGTSHTSTSFHASTTTFFSTAAGPASMNGAPILTVTTGPETINLTGGASGPYNIFGAHPNNILPTPDVKDYQAVGGGVTTLVMHVSTTTTIVPDIPPKTINFSVPSNSPAFGLTLKITYNYTVPKPVAIYTITDTEGNNVVVKLTCTIGGGRLITLTSSGQLHSDGQVQLATLLQAISTNLTPQGDK